MASLRKATAYSKKKVLPFTRVSKRRQKSYIKTVPPQKNCEICYGKRITSSKRKIASPVDFGFNRKSSNQAQCIRGLQTIY